MNERIRELRKSLGLTLKEFSRRLGVTDAAISRIEKGNRGITDQMVKSICREFDVDEKWLRTGDGKMFSDKDIDFGTICAKIGASDERANKAISDYYSLSAQDKELFWNFIERFLK